ncbi:xanthine dehydrogenase family protein molybdopterin-binding subunit [Streptomyces collinus]|uniref:Xanthine dehydrogenase YagR molybdenum-binding subunit n=1 Tax=Streptomyces collinus TaxID=42684 RepID=A0AA89TVB1_STRCU|nr:xanthine dehydrogenase family protein molybdopterin-binding subunit [Streptomyces collinus]MBB5809728.1 xanthine dehydrogenase YagR molybdenum-binding subunit [Streptomyces collinus]WMX63047.1 xanthine dehydrogenase family protein molybdopterin-binding subunit [Streptomyces collinus]
MTFRTDSTEIPESGIGAPVNRVEARDKVTGSARYTADVRLRGMAHATVVTSTISAGRVRRIDTTRALGAPGVLTVITHRDRMPWRGTPADTGYLENRFPLADDKIAYSGQHLAIVVAKSLEQAQHAASLLDIDYEVHEPVPTMEEALPDAHTASGRLIRPPWPQHVVLPPGADPQAALAGADVRTDSTYRVPHFSHVPLEPGAVVAEWSGGTLTLHDCSQDVHGHREVVAAVFGLPPERVRVLSPLVGGAFGNKTDVWGHSLLAAHAARVVRRPVKLVLSRKQVFTSTGHQPPIVQRIRLGAGGEGRLAVILHDTVNATEVRGDRPEPAIVSTAASYAAPVLAMDAKITKVNIGPSISLRSPGDAPGSFALESAMDELSYRLGMDPLELRRRNHLTTDPLTGKPWSAKHLLQAYEMGAERFGWSRRTAEPRSMRDGGELVGYGMATAVRGEIPDQARAEVEIRADGTAQVRTATQEIGTGALTLVAQITAAGTGVPLGRVSVRAGDTNLPRTAGNAGSRTTGYTGSAVHLAAEKARKAAVRTAVTDPDSPLYGLADGEVEAADGRLFHRDDTKRGETYRALLARNDGKPVLAEASYTPRTSHSVATFGAHFTEVRIDPDLPRVRVTRHVAVFDVGRITNHKAARNQAQGGIVFGMGWALMEKLTPDPVSGRYIDPALTDYHIPVNADVPDIEVLFIDEPDTIAHPHGSKGMGEVVSVGVAAAIANAVHHATGRRITELPITPDKLVG